MIIENEPHRLSPALIVRLGIWNKAKTDIRSDDPSVQRSLNISTDCGLIGDAKSIGTSAGRKILFEFFALMMLTARMSRKRAEIAKSTIFSFARSCSAISPFKKPSRASAADISSPGSPSSSVSRTVTVLSALSVLLSSMAPNNPIMPPKTIMITKMTAQVFIIFLSVLRSEWEA